MGEPAAVHSRRRFRLMPPQAGAPNTPPVDPRLWIVHYGPAEKSDRLPVNMIPVTPQMQQTLNFRQQLMSMGQIVRKEFMLSDRVNWPHLPLPGRGNAMYAPPANVRGVPQTMAYPPHGPPAAGPTPKRRAGQVAPQAQAHQQPMIGAVPSLEAAYDDEEDTSRGDLFDQMTLREVSIARYQQNHEWMEEILSSPYRILQIIAPDLGLGLKGELASLTDGIFEAQGSEALSVPPKKPYIGQLDPGLAAEFEKRVQEKIESTNAEIEQMKADHAEVVAKLRDNAIIKDAEIDLRSTVEEMGPEFWRLEGRLEEDEDGAIRSPQRHEKKSIEDILAQVEVPLGKHAAVVHDVHRVQDGGYQEPLPEPEPVPQAPQMAIGVPDAGASAPMSRQLSQNESQNSGIMIGDSDIDMGGTAAGLLDQMHTGFSSTPTPVNNFPTPQPHLSAMASSVATPSNINAPSPQPTQATSAAQPPTSAAHAAGDVRMEDASAAKAEAPTIPDQGTGSGDWVVVQKTDGSGNPSPNAPGASGTPQPQPTSTTEPATQAQHNQVPSKPASAAPTPGDGSAFDGDHGDFSSLGDLDTAGDALASYDGAGGSDLAEGLDLNMDMEDSAFGDAFHGVDRSAGGTPADGGI